MRNLNTNNEKSQCKTFFKAPQKASRARFIYLEICGSEVCVTF